MFYNTFVLVSLLALSSVSIAQTWTSCNPLNGTCPSDLALGVSNYTVDFTKSLDSSIWNSTAGTTGTSANGASFTINKRFDSPTIQSNFYIFFGSVEVHLKAATGQGIISSIVLESDDLDEIDWEWMGGNTTHVETNYFGKGNTTAYDRAVYYPVAGGPMADFHNYTVHWTSASIQWYIDTVLVRTLNYADANGGKNFPQTPMNIRLGIWAGGDASNNPYTIEWAGGATDYTKGPFTMMVQSAKIQDFSSGKSYSYSDTSGSWQSIKAAAGNSTVATTITAGPTAAAPSVMQKIQSMPIGAQVGIYAGSGAAALLLISSIAFCCIRSRRRGRKERLEQDARIEAQQKEDAIYAGMAPQQQDMLQTNAATPAEYAAGGYFAATKPQSDSAETGSLLKTDYDSRPTTPAPPPLYRTNTAQSGGSLPPVYRSRTPQQATHADTGFNFSQNEPSRGYGPVLASPTYSNGPVSPAYSAHGWPSQHGYQHPEHSYQDYGRGNGVSGYGNPGRF